LKNKITASAFISPLFSILFALHRLLASRRISDGGKEKDGITSRISKEKEKKDGKINKANRRKDGDNKKIHGDDDVKRRNDYNGEN
jgi:phosphate/sulfate permease